MNILQKIKYKILLLYYSLPTITIRPPTKDPRERVEEQFLYGYSFIGAGYSNLDYDLMAWLLPRLKLHYHSIEKNDGGVPLGFQKSTWLEIVADMIYFVENYESNYPDRVDEKRASKGRRDLIRYLNRLWN